jgi:flagellum-specific ATP synthase
MGNVVDKTHLQLAQRFKYLYSLLKENEVLIRIGAYQQGVDRDLDEAISKKEAMENFLKQNPDELYKYEETLNLLKNII